MPFDIRFFQESCSSKLRRGVDNVYVRVRACEKSGGFEIALQGEVEIDVALYAYWLTFYDGRLELPTSRGVLRSLPEQLRAVCAVDRFHRPVFIDFDIDGHEAGDACGFSRLRVVWIDLLRSHLN